MKKDKKPFNNKHQRHGLWEYYYSNGQLHYKGNYTNGKIDGLWEGYYPNGQLHYKNNYINGERYGLWFDNYRKDKHALYIRI